MQSEDEATRRRNALASRTQPPPGWIPEQHREPSFRWSGPTHGFEASQGVLLFHINERCVVGLFIIVPGFGCQIGKIEHHGDLFAHMHGPVRFGDWKGR